MPPSTGCGAEWEGSVTFSLPSPTGPVRVSEYRTYVCVLKQDGHKGYCCDPGYPGEPDFNSKTGPVRVTGEVNGVKQYSSIVTAKGA